MNATKRCNHCHRVLPVDEFMVRNESPDGRQHFCKECARRYDRMRKTNKPRNREESKGLLKKLEESADADLPSRTKILERYGYKGVDEWEN